MFIFGWFVAVSYFKFSPFEDIRKATGSTIYNWGFTLYCQTLTIVIPAYVAWKTTRSPNENITRGMFERIFESPQLYAMFKESVSRDLCLENIQFYEDMKEFLLRFGFNPDLLSKDTSIVVASHSSRSIDPRKDLRTLQRKFFASDSLYQLNLPDELLNAVTEACNRAH